MPTILIQVLSKGFSKIAQDKRIRAHTLLHKIITQTISNYYTEVQLKQQ